MVKNHYITIPAESSNPIKEHEINILDRLNQERVIGRGGGFNNKQLKGYVINKMSGGGNCEEMKGGSRANNSWVEHVRKYAKENDITYGCAITEARSTYVKIDKKKKTQELNPKIIEKLKIIEKSYDQVSLDLQQNLLMAGTEKIKNALIKLNFRGKIQANPFLRNMQILQNFNSIEKMNSLLNELSK